MIRTTVAVIGGGPAGITCAAQLQREGIETILIEREQLGGTVRAARSIENLPTTEKGISGNKLALSLAEFAKQSGLNILQDSITNITKTSDNFLLQGNTKIEADFTVIATGLKNKTPNLPNWLKDKLHSNWDIPTPGGAVLIVGGGDVAFDRALSWREAGWEVAIMHRSESLKALPLLVERSQAAGIDFLISEIDSLKKSVNGFKILNGKQIFQRLAIHIGRTPNIPEVLDESRNVIPTPCTPHGQTQLKNLYMAGDAAGNGARQISIAMGDGMRVACSISEIIKSQI